MIAQTAALFFGLSVLLPAHGTILGTGPHGTAIVRNDPVTSMLPAQTRAYRLSPLVRAPVGTGIDGFIDRSRLPWNWDDAVIAGRFTPGLPRQGRVIPIDIGSPLPHTSLIDQRGTFIDLAKMFPNKVVVLSFIFTRCPDKDECPAVSAKFAYLQQHLDAARFHLVELTLDPRYDSPLVTERYAAKFGARPQAWSILTGRPSEVSHLLDRFGISSLQVSEANFVHNDKVFLTQPGGRIATIVQTAAFSPQSLAAEARHLAGMASNPFGRLELSLIAAAAALCGGSQFAGIVLLETVAFMIVATLGFIALGWVARKLWKNA